MEDNYLDKVFQDKLESPQHFDFDEAAWENLAARLEDEPNRRIIPWQWLAAAGIVLPLLLSSVYFYQQLKRTEKTVAKLEAQFDNLANNLGIEKDRKNDTELVEAIATKEEKTQIQSVAKKKENEELVKLKNQSKAIAAQATSSINERIPKATLVTTDKVIFGNKEINHTVHKENKEIENAENLFVFGENAKYLNKIVYTNAKITKRATNNQRLENFITKEKVLEVKESNWEKAKYIFIPVGFEIGAVYQIGLTFAKGLPLEQKPYFNTQGVRGAINFANHVDLTVGASYATASFETQTIGRDFPQVTPNEPSDVFQRVVVSENMLQIPIGLKYNFRNYNALFSPFVEVGAIARKVRQKVHKYEYQPSNSGEEHYAITPKPQPVSESLAMNTVTGTLGLTWNPSGKVLDNFALQAEIFTAADIENPEIPVTTVGVGVSAKYMF